MSETLNFESQNSLGQDERSDRAIIRLVMALVIGACAFVGVLLALGAAGLLEPTCADAPAGVHVGVCHEFASSAASEMTNPYAIPPVTYRLEMETPAP
ncbi:MAG TPA: hypothetical protein PL074_02930 [Thermoflexales bacterium]|nr:hypothetical protein [Thermoflexales bacterium]